ncbi:MAG: carbon-nitrogen hydrolase family protein [Sphingomonadales bacterium]|nr:carbon-nitrogen hydrolase family protein [Sphingomonadales bacterium]
MKIALLQMTSGIDPARNGRTIVDAVAEAKRGGATMLFTPEMSGLIDRNRTRGRANVRDEADDIVLEAVRAAAAEHGLWVSIGSLAISGARDDGRLVNRSFLIDANGGIAARYDKIHLFDVDLPTGESWRESSAYAPGEQAVIAETPLGALGLSICYDMRFPALYGALTGAGATILTVPAAFTVPTGQAHWHLLLRARAVEGGAFVIAAAQTGLHEDGRETFGHSLVADPWGNVLLDMGTEPGLGFCDLDLDDVGRVRNRIPVIAHRRVFSLPVATP